MAKIQFGRPSTKKCPECGGETVIEEEIYFGKKTLTRRCDSLIVNESNQLDACMWSEEIHKNGKPITHDHS